MLFATAAGAERLDDYRFFLSQFYDAPLRWENVEGPPLWRAGVRPRHQDGLDAVHLDPEETATILLPARAWLMLRRADAAWLSPSRRQTEGDDRPLVWISDGSPVFRRVEPIHYEDTLLIPPDPQSRDSRAVRLQGLREVAVGIFVGFPPRLDEVVPYRRPLVPEDETPSVEIGRPWAGGLWDDDRYWEIHPGQPWTIQLAGPARLALESRIRYRPRDVQRDQNYHLEARLDGVAYRVLVHETAVDVQQIAIDEKNDENGTFARNEIGQPVLGRRERTYLDVPPGEHRLELDATAPLYLRVLALGDFLYDGNRPPGGDLEAWWERLVNADLPVSGVAKSRQLDRPEKPFLGRVEGLGALERQAYALSHDNGYRNRGTAGVGMLLSAWEPLTAHRETEPLLHAAARDLRGSHTFFRDLLPDVKGPPQRQFLAYFRGPRLHNPLASSAEEPEIARQHLPDFLRSLARAYFYPVPERERPARYRLPPRPEPTRLRLAVWTPPSADGTSRAAELRLQLRRGASAAVQPPVQVIAVLPQDVHAELGLPLDPPSTSVAYKALSTVGQRLDEVFQNGTVQDRGTLDGPLNRWYPTGDLLEAGVFEIELPTDVDEALIWHEAGDETYVAVQYMASSTYRLSERDTFEMLRRLEPSTPANFVSRTSTSRSRFTDNLVERGLDPRGRAVVASMTRPGPADQASLAGLAAFELAQVHEPLRRLLETRGKPMRASVSSDWRLPHNSNGNRGDEDEDRLLHDLRGQVEALLADGEEFLATQKMRAVYLNEDSERLRAAARDWLDQRYRRAGNSEALEALWSIELLRFSTPEAHWNLADALIDDGEFEAALLVGLAVPLPEREGRRRALTTLLRATYQRDWWRLFDELLEHLDDGERAFWEGVRQLKTGTIAEARQAFAGAGLRGRPFIEAMDRAADIRRRLAMQEDPHALRQTLRDWEAWEAEHPGPRTWRNEPALVADSAGGVVLVSRDRDTYAHFHRARSDRPLRLAVHGPLRLRLTVRPLHPYGEKERAMAPHEQLPIDDWLMVRLGNATEKVLIRNNQASDGLLPIAGEPAPWRAGTKVETEVDVPPGPWEVAVAAVSNEVLVSLAAERPEIPLGILPLLSPETVTAFVGPKIAGEAVDEKQKTPQPISAGQARSAAWVATPALPVKPDLPLSALMPTRAFIAPDDDRAALADVTRLIVEASQKSDERERIWMEAHALLEKNAGVPGFGALYSYLLRGSRWERVRTAQSSAGVRRLDLIGWEPGSPRLRIRQALLDTIPENATLITGDDRLALALTNFQPTRLELEVRIADVPFLPPQPLRAFYQLDASEPVALNLGPRQTSARAQIDVPEGDHVVRVWNEQAFINQYLVAEIHELRDGGPGLVRKLEPVAPEETRTWFVATGDEPVVLGLPGPGLVRVDRLREDGVTVSTYHAVRASWEQMELQPEDGKQESLYRIFRLGTDPRIDARISAVTGMPLASDDAVQRPITWPIEDVPDYRYRRPAPSPPGTALLDTGPAALPDQEDATWSARLRWVQRREFEDDGPLDADRFVEIRSTRRTIEDAVRHDFWDLSHWDAFALVREREVGTRTIGVGGGVRVRPRRVPLTFFADAQAYQQEIAGQTENSFHFQAQVTHRHDLGARLDHVPQLTFFYRSMSLADGPVPDGVRIDHDIYTDYKEEHPMGLRISDVVRFQPWLDSTAWARATLVTNDDFDLSDPELFSLRGGWQQLLGDFRLAGELRWLRFFNDPHRSSARDRYAAILEADWEDGWIKGRRFEIGGRLRYDFHDRQLSGWISFDLHLESGNYFRDFRPGLRFQQLRERRLLAEDAARSRKQQQGEGAE